MVKKGSKRQLRKSKKGQSNMDVGPDAGVAVYTGPIKTIRDKQEVKTTVEVCTEVIQFSSTGANIINVVVGNAPGSTSQWSQFAGAYDEYRTLGFKVHFLPYSKYNSPLYAHGAGALGLPIVYGVVDHDNAGALTSIANATAYSSIVPCPLWREWSVTAKMNGLDEAQYINTSSPTNNAWIKFYCPNEQLDSSQVYGDLFVQYRVQFRGKGL